MTDPSEDMRFLLNLIPKQPNQRKEGTVPYASLQLFLQEQCRDLQAVDRDLVNVARQTGTLALCVEGLYAVADVPYPIEARKFVEDMPRTVAEAIRAAIVDAHDASINVNLHFSPSYAYGVKVVEWGTGGERIVNVDVEGPTPDYATPFGFDALA